MNKLLTIVSTFLLLFNFINAQDVLLEENLKNDTIVSKIGKNKKHFKHLYFDLGFFAGNSENGAEIQYGKSHTYTAGFNYKYRVSNFYSIGANINLGAMTFSLKQNDNKLLPDSVLHDKEKFEFNNIGIGIYNRFNFGKRGNSIGKYLEIGAYGNFAYVIKHYTKDEFTNSNFELMEVSYTKLSYVERLNYGLIAKIGYNQYVVYAKYRLSNLFNDEIGSLPELSKLSIGFQVGIFK